MHEENNITNLSHVLAKGEQQTATVNAFLKLRLKISTSIWTRMIIAGVDIWQLRERVCYSLKWKKNAQNFLKILKNEMCHFILLWYFQMSAPVSYWLQAPSVNQTYPFLSWLGQFFLHSSLVSITIRYLLKMHHRVTWSFIIRNLLSILSAFAQIQFCPVPRFLRSGLSRRYAAISAADSTTIPSDGRSKSISSTFVGVVLIAPVIIVHAVLCRHSS